MRNVLLVFFNKCFTSGIIPEEWSKSLVTPLLKGKAKDSTTLNNYRGISLLSHVYKIFTGLLNKRLTNYLESTGRLADEQNGFRKGRSCIDHIYALTSIIRNRKLSNKSTYCCFIDMAKAFDSVDRKLLLHQCLKYGIGGNLYKSLVAIYNKTLCSVIINNEYGIWFNTKTGVKQGDSLSPLLFSLYVNELTFALNEAGLGVPFGNESVSILLYADDIVLLAPSPENLQLMLDIVYDWRRKFRMTVNNEKNKYYALSQKK